ncbi:MAG: hypothetical protein MUF61_02810 [archaeon]|jgi:hypothetical protein|nr:hypothetical protein [archaeon]
MTSHRKALFKIAIYMAVIAALVIAGTVAIFIITLPSIVGFSVQGDSNSEHSENIKTGTFAVCEQKDGYTFCEDRVFASCNHNPIEVINGSFGCNGKVYSIEESELGEAYLPAGWEDPRPANSITAWAASE